ncbi:MAG: DUF4926 domain-containing protein [Coraliomargaritaceae bacterium]
MIEEHSNIILCKDLPAHRLQKGDIGTVIHTHPKGTAYEVEFTTMTGSTLAVCTLEADMLQAVDAGMIPHARELAL